MFQPTENVTRSRKEKCGQVKKYEKQAFCLIFEYTPVWLLCLRGDFTSRIFLHKCNSLAQFYSRLDEYKIAKPLFAHCISTFPTNVFCFSTPPANTLYLVSGSISFLNELPPWLRHKKGIFITESFTKCRRKLPNSSFAPLSRISHSQVGGVTTFQGLCFYFHDQILPPESTFLRKLGDFLDFSIPPFTCKTPPVMISHNSLLPWEQIYQMVQYPSHFSKTGYGYRYLTATEMHKILGLHPIYPVSCTTSHQLPFIVPLQILEHLLLPVLKHHDLPQSPEVVNPHFPPIYEDKGFHPIAALNMNLSNDWYLSAPPSTSAVKDDTAAINEHIWDQRILLLFPSFNKPQLDWYRRRLFLKLVSNLRRELIHFLSTHNPRLWNARSCSLQQLTWGG